MRYYQGGRRVPGSLAGAIRGGLAFMILSLVGSVSPTTGQETVGDVEIVVAYHSETGNTERMAGAICEGIRRSPASKCILKRVEEVTEAELESMDGLLLGGPVHWANLSSSVKSFIDRLGAQMLANKRIGPEAAPESDVDFRTAGAFVTGGSVASGKELARIGMLSAFLNLRFVLVGGEDDDGFGTFGAQATTGPDDPGLDESELAEARAYGERFAMVTRSLRR